MSEFDLFSKLLSQQYNEPIPISTPEVHTNEHTPVLHTNIICSTNAIFSCEHTHIVLEHGASLCVDCGIEIQRKLTYEKEWKYYGMNDTKHSTDPNRCYIRKNKDRSIYVDIENMNISKHIKDKANDIYLQVCGEKVHRGAYRRAIVFASIFHAYKLASNPQSCESLIEIFKIKRKDALKGLKFISENAPVDSPLRTMYITPQDLIREFMKNLNASIEDTDKVICIYKSLYGKSSMLNRSRPQSTASGCIWFYMKISKRQMSIKDFVKIVNLSELTVNKVYKEIARVFEINIPKETYRQI